MSVPSDHKEFIYGGPWVSQPITAPFVNSVTPRNVQLRGIYKRSYAYYTLSDRLPVILTKVIDHLSRKGGDKASIAAISKLKNDLVTNKKIEPLKETSDEAKEWNKYILAMDEPYYFTAVWVFTECYIYRKLRECIELHMRDFDPFQEQKCDAFKQNLDASCIVARKLDELVNSDTIKESLVLLLKLSLWANKCDLSLTGGDSAEEMLDPVVMISMLKPNLLVDDANKAADFILEKCTALQKKINDKHAALEKKPEDEKIEEPKMEEKKIEPKQDEVIPTEKRFPCLSKMTFSNAVTIDIVCDNAGYELLTDLCLGYFLLSKNIATRVRYHVKAIPWFVSDVTPRDFQWVVDQCAGANFTKELPKKQGKEEQPSQFVSNGTSLDKNPAQFITSKYLQTLGKGCQQYLKEGRMIVEADHFWTSPNVYKDMKRLDPNLYRKLQFAVVIIFKGDLNYRKLMGEMNWPPTMPFDQALQGFIPAPLVAVRTVKADLIAGLPKNKWEELTSHDDKWMEKGDYGLIQFCSKKEDPKVTDAPCPDYGHKCQGVCL